MQGEAGTAEGCVIRRADGSQWLGGRVLLLEGAVLQFAFNIEKTGETRWAELKRNRLTDDGERQNGSRSRGTRLGVA